MSGNYPDGMSQRDWSYVNGEHLVDELLSECCSAPLLGSDEDPICSECREHCEGVEDEPDFPDDRDYDPME